MGRMALIIVLGLSVTVGIVAYSLNSSKTGTVENVSGFHKYTTVRDIAHTAVNMALRYLDTDDSTFLANKSMSVNVMGGSATVSYSFPNIANLDTMDLVATAHYMDSTKNMNLRLYRTPVPFPTIGEAVGLHVKSVQFEIDGAAGLIDGHNHDANGNLLPPSADDKPGVGVLSPSDTATINAAEASNMGEQIKGTKDVAVDSSMSDPAQYVSQYIAAADYKYPAGTYGSAMTWGSSTNPQIVYADGSSSQVKFTGNITGWGILVVKGNLSISGSFAFHGLVIAYNDVTIEQVSLSTGTPTIIGGFLMAGADGSKFTMKGNDTFAYSKEALRIAKYINKLQVYRVMRWYE